MRRRRCLAYGEPREPPSNLKFFFDAVAARLPRASGFPETAAAMLHLLLIALALCAASVDLDGDGDTDQLLKDFNTGFSQSTKGLYSKTKGELLANANEWASKEHVGEAKAAFKMAEQSSALDNLEASLDGSARMDLGEGPTQAASEKDRLPQKEGKSGTQSEAGLHHDMASPHID